jgi:hypothetical protein
MNCFSNNGRIDIMEPDTNTQFSMQDRIPVDDNSSFRDAMNGNWNDTPLSTTFFSSANIQIIQNGIRAGVYKKSNNQHIIDPQDGDTLKVIMRAMFLQHASNLPTQIAQQVEALNNLVLDHCIPQVYGELEGYIKYKQDVSTMYIPIEPPVFADHNDKTLEQKPWF